MYLNNFIVLGATKKQESVSSSDSTAACAMCDDVTAVIPDVVIFSADAVTDESRAASSTIVSAEVGGDGGDPSSAALTASATAGIEPPYRVRSLSSGDLSAMPANSRSLPQLPFIAAVEVPGGQSSRDFSVDPVSRRSLSSLQLAGVRTWCYRGGLRPGGSLSSVAVETPLTSSASSAATTAGCAGGSDVSGCVADSLDDEEPAPSTLPPLPASTEKLSSDQFHTERHVGDLTTPVDVWNRSDVRPVVSGVDSDCQRHAGSSSLSVCNDEDANVEQRRQRLQQQKRQRQFGRRQRRVASGQPSSNSLDELQQRTPPKLVQSSASLTSAPCGEVPAAYCRKDALKSTASDGVYRSTPGNSVVVDLTPLQNGNSWQESPVTGATLRTARSTAPPLIDGGLRLPDPWSQDSTLHAARPLPMTTTWAANKAQTAVSCAPRRARNAWSKSQEIHPKTSGGVCSLRGSASATFISVRRRNSLHAVFVDDSRTAVLKDVVIPFRCWHLLHLLLAKRNAVYFGQ